MQDPTTPPPPEPPAYAVPDIETIGWLVDHVRDCLKHINAEVHVHGDHTSDTGFILAIEGVAIDEYDERLIPPARTYEVEAEVTYYDHDFEFDGDHFTSMVLAEVRDGHRPLDDEDGDWRVGESLEHAGNDEVRIEPTVRVTADVTTVVSAIITVQGEEDVDDRLSDLFPDAGNIRVVGQHPVDP